MPAPDLTTEATHRSDDQLFALQHITARQLRLLIGLHVVQLWLLYVLLLVLWMASVQRHLGFPPDLYAVVITVCSILGVVAIGVVIWLFRTA